MTKKDNLHYSAMSNVPELTTSRQYVHLCRRVLPGNTENNKKSGSCKKHLAKVFFIDF
jgi:hypothetical protein